MPVLRHWHCLLRLCSAIFVWIYHLVLVLVAVFHFVCCTSTAFLPKNSLITLHNARQTDAQASHWRTGGDHQDALVLRGWRLSSRTLKSNNLSLNEAVDVAQNRPLWRLMSTFGATHSKWCMLGMMKMMTIRFNIRWCQYLFVDVVVCRQNADRSSALWLPVRGATWRLCDASVRQVRSGPVVYHTVINYQSNCIIECEIRFGSTIECCCCKSMDQFSRHGNTRHHEILLTIKSHGCRWNEAESAFAFQLVNGGRCSSDVSQHDWGSRLSSRCCPRLEQPTVVCHVSVVTVDFQATFKDVLVRGVVLKALTSVLLPAFPYLPNTSFFSFFVCYVSLQFLD